MTDVPAHPELLLQQVAHVRSNLGTVLSALDRDAAAEQHLRGAIEIWKSTHGAEHPWVGHARVNLGVVLKKQGLREEALSQYLQALEILHRDEPGAQDDDAVASVMLNAGVLLKDLGRHAEAEGRYQQALDILTRRVDPNDPRIAGVLNKLGSLALVQGRAAAAEDLHRRALMIYESGRGPERRMLVPTLRALGQAQLAQGQLKAARSSLEQALATDEAAVARPRDLARLELVLAEVLWRSSASTLARRRAERARDRLIAHGDAALRDEILRWLDTH